LYILVIYIEQIQQTFEKKKAYMLSCGRKTLEFAECQCMNLKKKPTPIH
jgi:hypothetical protein